MKCHCYMSIFSTMKIEGWKSIYLPLVTFDKWKSVNSLQIMLVWAVLLLLYLWYDLRFQDKYWRGFSVVEHIVQNTQKNSSAFDLASARSLCHTQLIYINVSNYSKIESHVLCMNLYDCIYNILHIFFSVLRLQPNLETQKKQVTAWCDLVLAYHKHHKIYTLDVKEAVSSPIFNNSKIQSILVK